MKIMITGATGYIGHQLALEAANRNYKVHILVRNTRSPGLPEHPNITVFKGDVTEISSLKAAMTGCHYVMHAAAVTSLSEKDNSIFYKVNVEGTRNVLETAKEQGILKLVYTSTGAVIGPSDKLPMTENDPRITAFENDYEISKYWAEELVRGYSSRGLYSIIVAAPRVYGPGIGARGNFIERLLRKICSMGVAFVPPCRKIQANYAYLKDVVRGHFLALDKGIGGEKYILGGENISYEDFFKAIKNQAGKKIRLITIPKFLMLAWSFFHMILFRLSGRHTNISPKLIFRLYQNRALSSEKAKRQLGYSITPFSVGIRQTILQLKNKNNV